MNEVAYSPAPLENPNFVSRPPDPGALDLYKSLGYDTLYHSPFWSVMRSSELMLEKNPYFNVDGPTLEPAEAAKKYGLNGQLNFDEPIKESAAALLMNRKIMENDREYNISRGETSGFRSVAGIGVSMGAALLDPINVASMFLPVVGEARFARMVSRFGGSVLKARLAAGAIEGTAGMAMVEPFVLLPAMQEQSNYGLKDAATNLVYGAALGGLLHAGFGAIGDRMRGMKPRDVDAQFESAMNNIMRDEPVLGPAKIADMSEDSLRAQAAESVRPQDMMEPYTFREPTTPITTNLGDIIGREVEYAGYSGKLIRDEEGNFVVLREVTLDGSPNYVEVSGTGKDANLQASEVGVFPKGTETRMKELQQEKITNLQQQINDTKVRMEKQGQNLNVDTKTQSSPLTKLNEGVPSETSRAVESISKEADDLQASLDRRVPVDDEERIEFEAQKQELERAVKESIGNQPARERGVEAAVQCITRNLI